MSLFISSPFLSVGEKLALEDCGEIAAQMEFLLSQKGKKLELLKFLKGQDSIIHVWWVVKLLSMSVELIRLLSMLEETAAAKFFDANVPRYWAKNHTRRNENKNVYNVHAVRDIVRASVTSPCSLNRSTTLKLAKWGANYGMIYNFWDHDPTPWLRPW